MNGWLLFAVGVVFFCVSMGAFAEYRPVLGCGLLALSAAVFCWLMLDMGMR
jgi:hypothetical protein